MSEQTTILFVDDEPGIRATLPAILTGFGFEVTAAATVPEALGLITNRRFDVLISDLNIGQPGDGFTVVSAMRRTQPEATTFILTGYPAFETALEAIRQQVDDYLVKPADIENLVATIQQKLKGPRTNSHRIEPKPLADILEESKREIVQQWVSAAREDPEIGQAGLSDRELADYLPALIGNSSSGAATASSLTRRGRRPRRTGERASSKGARFRPSSGRRVFCRILWAAWCRTTCCGPT